MKEVQDQPPSVHVFVCINERPEPKMSCLRLGGMEFFTELRKRLKEQELNFRIQATKSGCLGYCNSVGTTVTIHSGGSPVARFTEVTLEDFDKVWSKIIEGVI